MLLAVRAASLSGTSVDRAREVVSAVDAAGADSAERVQLVAIAVHESHLRRGVETCATRGLGGAVGLWQREPRSDAERARLCAGGLATQARAALWHLRDCRHRWPADITCYAGRERRDDAVREIEGIAEALQ